MKIAIAISAFVFLLLLILKLTETISWSWWWMTLAPIVPFIVLALLYLIVYLLWMFFGGPIG